MHWWFKCHCCIMRCTSHQASPATSAGSSGVQSRPLSLLWTCLSRYPVQQMPACILKLSTLQKMQSQTADFAPPSAATWEKTFSARKVVLCVLWPATGITVQFIAKPKAVCALLFSQAVTSSNIGLWANMTPSIKRNLSLRCQRRTEPRP